MTFAVAAAGTGGHVYPGLAVGEALVARGAGRDDVLYVGGNRLEASVYPGAGFPFLEVELAGLRRSLTLANLALPRVVRRATGAIAAELEARRVAVLLGLGGYVTVPAVWASRRRGIPYVISEQNAEAGLANRIASRGAARVFGAFPHTKGLRTAEWVGNPVRSPLAHFDRAGLRPAALARWHLDPDLPVLGVFGGSLGARAVNRAVASALQDWQGPVMQVLHLAGQGYEEMSDRARVSPLRWVVLDFCDVMEEFYAAADLVLARSGGAVAELTATATPAVLMPGSFGSGGHQAANAGVLEEVGAAVVVEEGEAGRLGPVLASLLGDDTRRRNMAEAASRLARPHAAEAVADAMIELAGRMS